LLGAGVLVLAGCGPPDEPEIVPKDVLEEQMKATAAAAQALGNVPGLRHGAEARLREIGAAYERAGGGADPVMLARPDPKEPLDAIRGELVSHVRAVGLLPEPEYRELFAKVIASAAADEAALAPPRELTAFPGTP
jgi:hypothetical protein